MQEDLEPRSMSNKNPPTSGKSFQILPLSSPSPLLRYHHLGLLTVLHILVVGCEGFKQFINTTQLLQGGKEDCQEEKPGLALYPSCLCHGAPFYWHTTYHWVKPGSKRRS